MVTTLGNNIINAYTGGVQVKEIYSFGVKVWPTTTPIPSPANNQIIYTSSDGNVITPTVGSGSGQTGFGANIVSNTYTDGYGVITFDGPVLYTGYQSFYNKSTLRIVKLPSRIEYISSSSFLDSGLTEINIPNGVTDIYNNSFEGSSLRTITIPQSVYAIHNAAFMDCSLLDEVIVNATTPPELYKSATNEYVQFRNCSPNLQIKVPAASLNAYLTAPGWSTYASQIVGYSNTDEIDFTTLGLANTQVVDVDTYGPFSSGDMEVQFTTTNQNYTSKYYTSGTAVRVYRENSVVISSSRTISQIEFTWTGGSSYKPSSDVATPSGYDYQTCIWTGSANQVTLTRPNEANHWRLKSVLVTYQ